MGESVVVHPDDDGYGWRADDLDAVDTDLEVDEADPDTAVAGGGDAGESAARSDAVEGDTVEGDLEMDLDAAEAAESKDEPGAPH